MNGWKQGFAGTKPYFYHEAARTVTWKRPTLLEKETWQDYALFSQVGSEIREPSEALKSISCNLRLTPGSSRARTLWQNLVGSCGTST